MKTSYLAAIVLAAFVLVGAVAAAQDGQTPVGDAAPATEDGRLAGQQEQIAERFRQLERLLLRMAELTAPTDPRRAALLRRAVAQSKDRALDQRFDELVELLRQERLSAVIKNQGTVHADLVKLLDLLLSEDRSKRIETEKERVRAYLKRVNKIIKEQKSVQGQTRRDGDAGKLAEKQGELAGKTGELAGDIKADGETKPAETPDEPAAEKDAEKDGAPRDDSKPRKPGDSPEGKKPDEAESKDGEPGEGDDGKPSEGDEGQPGEPSDSEGKQAKGSEAPPVDPPEGGSPAQGQGGNPSPPPAQERLEQAQRRMQQAQEKLEEAQRSDAAEEQAEALRELERAKAELEEILRQLREEEMARTLAMLEGRFRKMLDAQIEVYEGTQRVDKVPADRRDRDDEIEAGRLSRKEAQIAVEAEKALDVLREEGSAVAFPEAVMEIRDDTFMVRDLLAEANVGQLTQGIEQDIIAALEEMIAALQKAQKDMENNKNSPPPGQAGGEVEMPLVDTLSELRMIRALQMRVNKRTKRYGAMVEADQLDRPELLEALRQLAEREQRIHKVTRDIVVGRNR